MGDSRSSLKQSHRLVQIYSWSAADLDKWLCFPKVDALITAMTKHITIPVEVNTALWDLQDRETEGLRKTVFSTAALALQASV